MRWSLCWYLEGATSRIISCWCPAVPFITPSAHMKWGREGGGKVKRERGNVLRWHRYIPGILFFLIDLLLSSNTSQKRKCRKEPDLSEAAGWNCTFGITTGITKFWRVLNLSMLLLSKPRAYLCICYRTKTQSPCLLFFILKLNLKQYGALTLQEARRGQMTTYQDHHSHKRIKELPYVDQTTGLAVSLAK